MKKILGLLLLFSFILSSSVAFGEEEKALAMKISLIEGSASNCLIKRKDAAEWQQAKIKDVLNEGDEIKTLTQVRAELVCTTGSIIRLNINSHFVVKRVAEENKGIADKIKLFLGKSWYKIKKISNAKTHFEVETPSAVAGVYGTTYRIDVPEDQSTSVKVYSGQVKVGSIPYQVPGPSELKDIGLHQVQGPKEVKGAGPKEVTQKEWTALISAQQQIVISFDNQQVDQGKFDLAEDEKDEWVQWNKKRDSELDWE